MSLIAELHCHSRSGRLPYYKKFYDSVMSVEEILNRCLELKIDILSITDHDSLSGYRKAKKLIRDNNIPIILVPGCEISSKQGHILAYGILKEIPPKLSASKTIDLIHQQGGIAVAAHPFNSGGSSLKLKIRKLGLDAIEGYCAAQTLPAIRRGIKWGRKLDRPMIGGSDAHALSMIGCGKMIFKAKRVKDWSEVLQLIKRKRFRVEVRRPNFIRFAREFVRTNIKIRKLDGNLPKTDHIQK